MDKNQLEYLGAPCLKFAWHFSDSDPDFLRIITV